MIFQGKNYKKNQLREMRETDNSSLAPLTDWFKESKVGEYTHYFSNIVFHTETGFFSCCADNLENYCRI